MDAADEIIQEGKQNLSYEDEFVLHEKESAEELIFIWMVL